jgi:hypothetical protein
MLNFSGSNLMIIRGPPVMRTGQPVWKASEFFYGIRNRNCPSVHQSSGPAHGFNQPEIKPRTRLRLKAARYSWVRGVSFHVCAGGSNPIHFYAIFPF